MDDPENAPNVYSRYVTAAQKKLFQGKKKAEGVAAQTKVNVAMTQQDSIFPQIKLPGGISSKATEYRELAASGDKWESPIFKLGSASPTSGLAAAPQITRKDHEVTQGGVRGPQNIGNTGSVTNRLNDPSAQTAGVNGPTTGGTSQFSNQVEQAFSSEGNLNGKTNGTTNGHTTLGSNNAVLTGNI
jgi:hypothetical protein